MLLPANHGIHRHVLAFRLTNCLFPIPASQPTVTEHFQSLLYRSGTVFRSISHLLHHFLSSALAWRHTSSNSVTNNYCCGACRRKWQLTDTDLCPCGETQTMSHIVESCPDKTEWQLISATLCGWRRCFVVDQLWLMKCIREETLRRGLLIISISGSYLRIYTVSLGEILACACVKNRIIRSMLRHLSLFQNFWDSLELFVGLDPRVPPQHMPM